jgi:hypothetical protein
MRATWMGKPERVRLQEEAESSGATWTGSPKGVFAERKHHKPRLALNNNTAGVHERQRPNRTRVLGHLDEIQGVVAYTLDLLRNGASLLANGAAGTRAR